MIDVMSKVDLTLLKATSKWEDIRLLCDEAKKYRAFSVCIPPVYVKRSNEYLNHNFKVCTVIGFPLGYQTTDTKVFETKGALKDGASEIDMVVNLTDIKNGEYDKIEDEIKRIKDVVGEKILKVIIETCYLDKSEKIKMCEIIKSSGADFVKTSTGYGTSGATLDDIKLLSEHSEGCIKIKASGGIRTRAFAEELIKAGASRIGSSSVLND
ncbi:deoxyribose-phosphate aldolase [Clostridioides mangenotii]|uniref:deoxyribose-phosphate aldolase n=1 Tax=Metaclostridioides mangenotii TaxID=1540 RepID=UPI001C10B1B3|nr:deoxyribose-phosphate aldolase [Clostridioides mangenotii]MBU5306384.1 deoxyribose-phosphate aldolase [Clostridioides mangenotii]